MHIWRGNSFSLIIHLLTIGTLIIYKIYDIIVSWISRFLMRYFRYAKIFFSLSNSLVQELPEVFVRALPIVVVVSVNSRKQFISRSMEFEECNSFTYLWHIVQWSTSTYISNISTNNTYAIDMMLKILFMQILDFGILSSQK